MFRAILLLAATILPVAAQEKPTAPDSFFSLTFVVREVDGDKVINSRSYYNTANIKTLNGFSVAASIRAGEKIPYASSEGSSTKWEQVSVGVNIDCQNLQLVGDRLALHVSAGIDSVAPREEKSGGNPIIRSNRWEGNVLVPLRQPTIIFSSDDPFSTHKFQLQLTAIPLR